MLDEISFIKENKFFCEGVFELFSVEGITEATTTAIDPLLVEIDGILVFDILPPREDIT